MTTTQPTPDIDLRKEVRSAGLVYVSDSAPGIRRMRHGKGFSYRTVDNRRLASEGEIKRIHALAIPPAYADVWICANPLGHLQATGRDARGRKQYRYHPRWRELRDHGKFGRLLAFGVALPRLRRRVRSDLARSGLPREKVLALLVRLLDETLIRIGNETYTRENHSYGLTTLRSRHVKAYRGRLHFTFHGKSAQERDIELGDRRLARIVGQIQQLPGQRLFQYVNEEGKHQAIDSGMVNAYLHEASGGEFTAKDFRTWGGTIKAIAVMARTPIPESGGERAQRSAIAEGVKEVAEVLGNTPAVCRSSYIHPQVFAGWLDGSLHKAVPESTISHRRQLEQRALRFLRRRLHPAARRSD